MRLLPSAVTDAEPVIDAGMLSRVRDGSIDALALLYDACHTQVFRIAYRLSGSRVEAEDVVHDVFVGLPRALRDYQDDERFDAWISRVTARVALMRMRATRSREQAHERLAREPARQGVTVESVLDRITIESALSALAEELRVVFVLRAIEGWSHAEIATELGIRANTSEVRYCRARQALRRMLKDDR